VKRLLRYYFAFFAAALALFALFAAQPRGRAEGDWDNQMARIVVLMLAGLSAAATWATAVALSSVHRLVWPLALATLAIAVATLSPMLRHALAG